MQEKERIQAHLELMLRIRRLEEKAAELYSAGHIRGFLHLYIGEEAIAAGIIPELAAEDAIMGTYREHGHALARGVSARAIMAEMFGKQEGCSRGRGGSMHLFDARLNFYGGNAIVGGHLPMAVGLGLAAKMQRSPRISVCFFGEGAMAEGEFHESMNLAALWQLPVLFVCENNLYAMGTALARSESEIDLCKKASSYHMKATSVDGMDVLSVHSAAVQILAEMRKDSRPQFLECKTYRFRAHSMFDAELYRNKAEVDEWQKRDPIALLKEYLQKQGALDENQLFALEKRVEQEMADAVAFAEQGTLEPASDLTKDVITPV